MKRTLATTALAALAALTLAGCASSGSSSNPGGSNAGAGSPSGSGTATGSGPIVIGSAAFSENELLADIYADALSAKGVSVSKHLNIGERGIYIKALEDGDITGVIEYNGSLLPFLEPTATAKSTTAVNSALATVLAGKGLAATDSAAAQDSDTITVTKATADKYHLTSIADLASVASKLTLGAPAQFRTRADGVPGLTSTYGVTFGRFVPTQAGGTATVTALKNGSIDAADIFSTDPSIAKNGFVTLTDPKNNFAAQNITPVFSQKVLTDQVKQIVNAVSAKLDTVTLAALVAKVSGGNADSVAQQWLKSVGLS